VTSQDEVGVLALTFNAMLDRVQNWQEELDREVEERTAELDRLNVSLVEEIEERARIDHERLKSEERYQTLFNTMLYGFALHEMIYDEDGEPADYRFLEINPAFEQMTGLRAAVLVGKTVLEVLPGTEEYWITTCGKVATTGEAVRFENYSQEIGKWFEVFAYSPAKGQFAVTFTDVTERRQAEEELERLNLELASKNIELERIVYAASHDLRSPLVNIQGFGKELERAYSKLEAILEDISIPPAAREGLVNILEDDIQTSLKFIYTGTDKMDSLLSGLLRFSRLGRVSLNITKLDMDKLVKKIVDSFQYQIQENDVMIEVEKLPSCYSDKGQVSQLLSNLVDNALKYLDPQRQGIIRIHGEKRDLVSVYCVEDNGIGVPEEYHERIFEIFYRLEPEAEKGEGLGLTIARKILNNLSGKIRVESEPGKGSKFFVSLPAEKFHIGPRTKPDQRIKAKDEP